MLGLLAMSPEATVIIPTIPERLHLLKRAVDSVMNQTVPCEILVKLDESGVGPARLRNEAVAETQTGFVAFLDDDDEFLPHHVELLLDAAKESDADVVYPWFHHVVNGKYSTKNFLYVRGAPAFGHPFDGDWLRKDNYVPVTTLVRRSSFNFVGGFPQPGSKAWPRQDCEDWGLWIKMVDHGMKFVHVPNRSWIWHWHSANTQGMPSRVKGITSPPQ